MDFYGGGSQSYDVENSGSRLPSAARPRAAAVGRATGTVSRFESGLGTTMADGTSKLGRKGRGPSLPSSGRPADAGAPRGGRRIAAGGGMGQGLSQGSSVFGSLAVSGDVSYTKRAPASKGLYSFDTTELGQFDLKPSKGGRRPGAPDWTKAADELKRSRAAQDRQRDRRLVALRESYRLKLAERKEARDKAARTLPGMPGAAARGHGAYESKEAGGGTSPMSTAASIRLHARQDAASSATGASLFPGASSGAGGASRSGVGSSAETRTKGGYNVVGGVRMGPGPAEIEAVRKAADAVGGDDTGGKVFQAFETLRTGEDAVTFFAHYGPQCPVKFVYLNRAKTGKAFRPYDLVVVPEEDVDLEHFTISAKGVVHVCPGEPSEFLTLSEWMRQSSAFNVVRNLRFFRQFVPRKMFDMWRTFSNYSKFRRRRRDIERKLFMASKVFCKPMMTIRYAVSHLQELQLVRLDGVRMTAATFADTQAQARAMAQKEIDRRLVRIVRVLKSVCKDVTDRAAAGGDDDADAAGAMGGGRTKGIREAKEEEMRKARALRQAAMEQSRLGALIRLVDYMVVEAFAGRCKQDVEALRDAMHSGQGQRSRVGLFMTELRFDDEGTVFAPNEQDFSSAIEEVVSETVDMVTKEPRMLSVRAFEPFLRELPVAYDAAAAGGVAPLGLDLRDAHSLGEDPRVLAALPEGFLSQADEALMKSVEPQTRLLGLGSPTVAELCYSLPELRAGMVQVLRKLTEDFDGARAFSEMESFKQVRPAYDYYRTQGLFDEDGHSQPYQIASSDDASSAVQAVSELRREMQKIAGWDAAVRSLTSTTTRGCLHVDAKELKAELEPLTERALGRVKEQLLHRSSGICRRLADVFQQRVSVFERRPQSLDEFARHKEDMARLQEEDNRLMEDAQVVEEMHKLVTTYRGRIPREDEFLAAEMKSLLGRYQDAMIQGKGFVESRMRDMRHQLDMRVFKLKETMAQLKDQVNEGEFVDASQHTGDMISKIESVEERVATMENRAQQFYAWQRLFGVEEDTFTALEVSKSSIQKRATLWRSLDEFITKHDHWVVEPFHTVSVEQLVADSNALMKASYVADRQLGDDVSAMFKEKTQAWRSALPVIEELGNPYMLDRHWSKLYKELKQPFKPADKSRTLGELIDYGVLEMRDLVSEVSGTASGEHQLEESLQAIASEWTEMKFLTRNYRELKHVYVLSGLDDIFVLLEDHYVTLQTMMGSRFIQGVRDEVESWDRRLALLSDTLDEWVQCMKQWQYLENIFSAEDIQRQLPAEASKFMTVDKRWKEVMLRTHTNPSVLASIENGDELLKTFQHCNMLLEEIQKSLDDYLETKRSAFPRFYFLSDEDLLAILSQTRDPQAVQPHLQGCFDAMKSLRFGKEDQAAEMFGMVSSENEEVEFTAPLTAAGNVENWLGDVERMMRRTLYDVTKQAMTEYPAEPQDQIDRKEWLFGYAAQPVLTVDQIFWAANVEKAIREMAQDPGALTRLLEFVRTQINAMVALVRTDLTKLQRRMLGALVVLDVHGRDVVAALEKKQVSAMEDFEWTRQLRYYWEEDVDNCVVRQTNTRFIFGYEYIGNQPRLVITPLTDKCYMTLTGALHLKFGGAPAGPAGTGKTETTKDLAKALAVQCVVFNCSDGLNFQMMGRFFSGLAQAGAWACFDEFNRINIEVLSVIAQQILVIQEGLKGGETHIEFEGKEIPLSSSFGVFITMNPGYAGRTELPDNLKSLFRPVAMMVPDYRLIAEIILFSQGFGEAFALSNKMAQLYKLASEQLSKQSHYDYGMRAVKSVLVAAGQLKRKEPDVDETILLIRSMRDSNVPKFLQQDLPLFQGIIKDLFPKAEVPFVDYGKLQEAIEFYLKLRGLALVPGLITKIIQTHETQLVRHGMMLVGEAGSGKSVNWQVLADALTQLKKEGIVDKDGFFQKVTSYVLNPKSVRMGELYGETSATTGEWTDGIISALARVAVRDTSKDRKWIVFDGPVDAIWIENMNTVLDDNKTLCLPNGQRIKLPPTLHMMFEVADLAVASPATVSRCGMVYMEFVHVGLDAIIETWSHGPIEDLIPEERDRLTDMVKQIAPKAIAYIRENCRQVVPATDGNILQSFLAMLDALLTPENGVMGSGFRRYPQSAAQKARERLLGGIGVGKPAADKAPASGAGAGESKEADAEAAAAPLDDVDAAAALVADIEEAMDGGMPAGGDSGGERPDGAMGDEELATVVNYIFTFAFVWSFGCNIHDKSRGKFQTFAKALLGQALPASLKDDEADLYDFYVDVPTRTIRPWHSRMDAFEYTPGTEYFDLVVPTVDTTRYAYLFKTLVEHGRGVYFTGETGVGKSVIVSDTVARMCAGDEAKFVTKTINLSAQTQASNIVDALEDALDKKRKTLLGPPAGKRMVVFVDDLNMPAKEEYGAMPPVELLRQGIDQKGFYDTTKLFFKNIADCIFCAACAPPGGGRSEVTPRLERHFHAIWIESLSRQSMMTIFESILGGFLAHTAASIADCSKPLVSAAVNVYKHVEQEMLPTPSKSHYTFNLRDLSKVFQGVLMVDPAYLQDEGALLRLWIHEELRVFRDRLVDDDDRKQFNVLIEEQLQTGPLHEVVKACQEAAEKAAEAKAAEEGDGAGAEASRILSHSGPAAWRKEGFRDLLFGDYLSRDEKKYSEIMEPEKLPEVFAENLDEYNISFPTYMHLVFFRDAVAHISRVARILRQPRGNAMLVGVGGSGRQSLTRLSAFIAEFQCMGIEITRTYNKEAWREDLKRVLMQAGAKAKDVVFLFSDTQIKEESFLEDINNILNSGDVPNLYAPDEFEAIIGDVRPLCKAAGKIDTRDNIWQHYISLVRSHLHVVLAFSPIGGSFRNRCRMFPSLVNCCTIDWFSAWPEDALYSVAESFLGKEGGRPLGIEGMVDPLCNMCVKIHRSVEVSSGRFLREKRRYNYTTPTSYLELLRLYTEMLTTYRGIVDGKISRYEGGLTKLAEAEKVVAELQVELTKLQPTLKKAAEDTEALLKQLAVDQKDADEAAAQAQKDEEATTKQAAEVKVIKDDCQKDLDEALPAYYGALKALDSLDKAQINEVKGFKKPPDLVVTVLEAVCILLQEKPDWSTAKRVMGDMKFIDRLKGYDKDSIDPKVIKKVGKYIKMEKFQPSEVKSVSLAATSLCMWVRAIFKYDAVAKNIEPKRKALNEAMASLEKAQAILEQKRAALREIQAKVADLQRQYENSVNEKERLERQQKQTEIKLGRAHKLIDGLGAEAGRWREAQVQLTEDKKNLTGNMILSAGCIAYTGPFTADFRRTMSAGWVQTCQAKRIPVDPRFELSRILADPVEVREWNIQGLPADDFSTENGLFATRGRRWPLMIDPQGQANRWVKQMQKDNGLRVIKLSEADFLRTLEHGIRFGQPILLENVEEELDPALEPVLLKQVFKKQGLATLRLGDSDVPYSDDFRFYITTKLANPHYMPEVCVKVTVINFTVTMSGLEDQLLVDVVAHERPDLEERKNKLIVSIASDKRQLKGIEDSILKMLAEAQGDILEDESLIDSLGQSKKTSAAINERMHEAERTTKEINEAREGYRTVATRGSVLYFVIADLANVNAMYQFSLQAFQRLYNMRIEKSEASEDLDKRLDILTNDITKSFYENLCRGLFERDKMLYSFQIAVSIAKQAGRITDEEWQFFLVGSAAKDDGGKAQHPPTQEWLSAKGWIQVLGLEKAVGGGSPLVGIADDLGTQLAGWKSFATDENPHLAKMPEPWESRLSDFQRLLVLRCIREEKTNFGVREFVRRQLGEKFCEPPPFDLDGVFEDSSSTMPIVFVLSAGADPVQYLLKLAEEKGKRDSLRIISLGQGQGPLAERHMEEARRSGDWVCLQNCHLAESWLPRLEAILEQTMGAGASGSSEIHYDFRLWLTSMPNPKFPVPILQNSIKLTQEPPRGLKANLRRTFLDLSDREYEGCTKPRPFKKLLFGLAFYHALILERRKFGAIGWNIPYEWMNSDLQTGIMQLRMYLEEQPNIPYETLNAVIGDITYGGRATDAWDKRTNLSILRRFFCPEVLEDGYRFSESGMYFAPAEGDLAGVREYIEQLPLDDPPDTFGLHPNAAITLQQKESNYLMSTLVSMQKGDGGGGGGGSGGQSPDEVVSVIVEDVLKRLPEPFDSSKAHPDTFATIEDGSINSLGVFAEQEMVRFNGLTQVVRASLLEMRKAIKGLVVMSPELEAMYSDFYFQRVPVPWEDAAYPSLKPLGSWIEDLMERLQTLQLWLTDGPPKCFWLSGFFFPQGFMTGALQTYARKTRIAIDTLTFKTNILSLNQEDVTVAPEDGVYVYGLYLEGARWDKENGRLAEMTPGVLFDYMPCIWLEPVEQSAFSKKELDYDCPVYKTSRRAGTLSTTGHSTNFIVTLQLDSAKPQDHWIRRGVALLSQLDD